MGGWCFEGKVGKGEDKIVVIYGQDRCMDASVYGWRNPDLFAARLERGSSAQNSASSPFKSLKCRRPISFYFVLNFDNHSPTTFPYSTQTSFPINLNILTSSRVTDQPATHTTEPFKESVSASFSVSQQSKSNLLQIYIQAPISH